MADLGTLTLGTFNSGLSSSTAITGTEPVLQAVASANDATYVADTNNATHTGVAVFALGDTPSDFGSMDSLSIQLRYRLGSALSNNTWDSLTAQVYQSDGTTALTNAVTIASGITTTTATNSSAVSLTGLNTSADKTVWDGALVFIRFNITRNKGGDSAEERVLAASVTGAYTVASLPEITGDLDATDPVDTAAIEGGVIVTGDLAATDPGDTAAIDGAVIVSGGFATTDHADTFAASGTVSDPSIEGDLAATDPTDTAVIEGTVLVSVALTATDVVDTAAFDGVVLVSGSLAATDAVDTSSIEGGVLVSGGLAATDAVDISAVDGAVIVNGALAATDPTDTLAAAGTVLVSGAFIATDAADDFAAEGSVSGAGISGSLDATEAQDTASFGGVVLVSGALSATDATDSFSGEGTVPSNERTGHLAAVEGADGFAGEGAVLVSGDVGATEGPDLAEFLASVDIEGFLDAMESGDAASVNIRLAVVRRRAMLRGVRGGNGGARFVLAGPAPRRQTRSGGGVRRNISEDRR